MSYRNILFETGADGVSLVAVNRPDKLNALNGETVEELDHAFARVESDASIRGLIVTGSGDKAFVAGADVNELAVASPIEGLGLSSRGQRVLRRLETMHKISVAAINGYALGGGLELAMSCTVRFASSTARLGQPEVKLGILPGYGGTQRLPRLVGRGIALEMLLSGDPIDAARAQAIGLVNAVYEPGELIGRSREWLVKALANAPVALGLVLDAVDTGLDSGLEEGLRFEAAAFAVTCASADRGEGTRAFLEKRKPVFAGK
jgi:enoyl-CoA hydratase